MTYVYILKSISRPDQNYIGVTGDLLTRLQQHNTGQSEYSRRFLPWKIETYLAFSSPVKAAEFERFLKKSGGWRFAKRRLIGAG